MDTSKPNIIAAHGSDLNSVTRRDHPR
jgi:hypothetical protein